MNGPGHPSFFDKHGDAYTYEKDDLHQPEKQVYPGHIDHQVFGGNHENENIHRNQKKTSQVNGVGVRLPEVGNSMHQDQRAGGKVQNTAGAF